MDFPSMTSETMASLVRLIDMLVGANNDAPSLSLPMLHSLRGLLRRAEKEVDATTNAHLPAVRLPPELLQYIFRLASLQVKDPPSGPLAAGDIWSLVEPVPATTSTLTAVCRRWRSVALADAALWNLIADRRDRRPLAVSRQSSSAALELRLLASPSPALRTLLHADGHRVKAVEWDKANARADDLILLAASSCQLDKLVLSMSRHLPPVSAHALSAHLATQAPSLRQLTLRDCSALPMCAFPGLTALHLDACPAPDACDALLGLLARAPCLADLVLTRLQLPDAGSDMLAPLALPSLRRLVFADTPRRAAAAFLARVALPSCASVRIHAGPLGVPSPSADALLFAALARTPALRDATDVCVAGNGDFLVAGPAAALCFVRAAPARAAGQVPAWDAPAVLRHALASARIRTVWLLGDGVGVPELTPSVDTVVVHDVRLGVALEALARRDASGSTTVHVLMTRFMAVGAVLARLAQHADAARRHVVVGYLPAYQGEREPPRGFEGAFASLRFEAHAEEPRVALPDVCGARAHCLWPAWLD